MSELIDTTEMYLRTLYELQEEGIPPLRARIAERLGQSGPTVSQTVARMERDGLVVLRSDRSLQLTPTGEEAAIRVMRKHRLAECLLVDVIGLPWEDVHIEACRWEHVMSEAVERRLVELLNHPTVSPFGNPIPGLGMIDDAVEADSRTTGGSSLADAAGAGGTLRVLRIGEHVQNDPALMGLLAGASVRPGAIVEVGQRADHVTLTGPQGAIQIPGWAAELILVEPTA